MHAARSATTACFQFSFRHCSYNAPGATWSCQIHRSFPSSTCTNVAADHRVLNILNLSGRTSTCQCVQHSVRSHTPAYTGPPVCLNTGCNTYKHRSNPPAHMKKEGMNTHTQYTHMQIHLSTHSSMSPYESTHRVLILFHTLFPLTTRCSSPLCLFSRDASLCHVEVHDHIISSSSDSLMSFRF